MSQSAACVPTLRPVEHVEQRHRERAHAVLVRREGKRAAAQRRQVKVGKGKARRLNLGKKSFTGKAGQVVTVRVRVAKERAQRDQAQEEVAGAEQTMSVRRACGQRSRARSKTTKLTLRASGK